MAIAVCVVEMQKNRSKIDIYLVNLFVAIDNIQNINTFI